MKAFFRYLLSIDERWKRGVRPDDIVWETPTSQQVYFSPTYKICSPCMTATLKPSWFVRLLLERVSPAREAQTEGALRYIATDSALGTTEYERSAQAFESNRE